MELIYVHIDKYRNFNQQDIHISSKFKIKYKFKENTIEIMRNKAFVDIYPSNIVGISAVIGKNASGKSSFLDLIGKRIEDRHYSNEISKEKYKINTHYKYELGSETSSELAFEVIASYFLIYYLGKDDAENDLFIFETSDIERYIGMFSNREFLTNNNRFEPKINYYISKGWFPCVFKCIDGKIEFLNNTQDCNIESNMNIHKYCSLISFKDSYKDAFEFNNKKNNDENNDEYIMSVMRRNAILKSKYLYEQIKFIVKQLNEDKISMFNDKEYKLNILYSMNNIPYLHININKTLNINNSVDDVFLFIKGLNCIEGIVGIEGIDKQLNINDELKSKITITDFINKEANNVNNKFFYNGYKLEFFSSDYIIIDYKDFDISKFTNEQKTVLKFAYDFACYAYTTIFNGSKKCFSKFNDNERQFVLNLINQNRSNTEYSEIKNYYYNQLLEIFLLTNNSKIYTTKFKKCIESLETFLDLANSNNIEVEDTYNGLIFTITKDTRIEKLETFFYNFIDEGVNETDNTELSIMNNFLNGYIDYLSDGERANLSMFAAINEQLTMFNSDKKSYILLFDEIERNMHPEMCKELISLLIQFLSQYKDKKFQVIISSHSPFIASDILKENIICLKKTNNIIETNSCIVNTFGQNIHTILKNEFFLETTYGDYSRKIIEFLVECIVENERNEFYNTIEVKDKINQFLGKKYIEKEEDAIFYIKEVIENIGERIIRQQLQIYYEKWFNKTQSIEKKIYYHQQKIKELEFENGKHND